jgi:hypothetical protein
MKKMKIVVPENGATVKAMYRVEWNRFVILARYHLDWVVWRMDNEGNCYWGNYFGEDLNAATVKFGELCKTEIWSVRNDFERVK